MTTATTPRFSDPERQQLLEAMARGTPGAVSRRLARNDLRYFPTLAGEIIKVGGTIGIPFGGYRTKREAVDKAKAIREDCRNELAQANGDS